MSPGTDSFNDFWRKETVTFRHCLQMERSLRAPAGRETTSTALRPPSVLPQARRKFRAIKCWKTQDRCRPMAFMLFLWPLGRTVPLTQARRGRASFPAVGWLGPVCVFTAPSTAPPPRSMPPGVSAVPFSESETLKLEGLGLVINLKCPALPL